MDNIGTPLISIVIPTFNHGSYLRRALQSLFEQSYTNWEAIVVDNHSIDNTPEVVSNFTDPRISFFKVHNNGIISISRNEGIRKAKGEWLAFLDSDDWWIKRKLELCSNHFSSDVDLIYHNLHIATESPHVFNRNKLSTRQLVKPVLRDLLLNGNLIPNSSVVVRKSLLDAIGLMDESPLLIGSEDYCSWMRIAQLSDRFLYLPFCLGYYLNHSEGISKKNMGPSYLSAVTPFLPLLPHRQTIQLHARYFYITGRYNYLHMNFVKAKSELLFSFFNASFSLRIKSFVMLLLMGLRSICSIISKL